MENIVALKCHNKLIKQGDVQTFNFEKHFWYPYHKRPDAIYIQAEHMTTKHHRDTMSTIAAMGQMSNKIFTIWNCWVSMSIIQGHLLQCSPFLHVTFTFPGPRTAFHFFLVWNLNQCCFSIMFRLVV